MVRNESRILRRCVESLSCCERVLVVDTGSTDDTVELAESLGCYVRRHEWKDFGHNRTLSFREAQALAPCCGAEWVLALDADHRLVCDRERLAAVLRRSTDAGLTLMQKHGDLEYRNVRLMRVEEDWRCKGVTHEYWTCRQGTVGEVPREAAYIDDVGDGGCKHDKFERDERLLEEGLREEPENERYVFYLANTKACEGKIEEAKELYRRRVSAGGWQEEVWYSMYQLAKHSELIEAEMWVQRALSVTDRTEALLWLIEKLRATGQFFKAWGYLQTAAAMAPPGESRLFLEADWAQRLAFERSVLHYYVSPDRDEGLCHCLEALDGPFEKQIRENLKFYVQRLPGEVVKLDFPAPEGFYSSSVAVTDSGLGNVRCVDYYIEPDGSYRHFEGRVVTRNFTFLYAPGSRSFSGFEEVRTPEPTHESWCHGLEDLRLSNDLTFTATCLQWRYEGQGERANRMAIGRYTRSLSFQVIRPPRETWCEKNWLPLGAGNFLYGWHPFEVGAVEAGALVVHSRHTTPAWWRHLRGSAPPFAVPSKGGERTMLVAHMVSDADPRHYFSLIVEIEPATWRPKAVSLPFVFFGGIEYCLSAQFFSGINDEEVHVFVSHWDRESFVVVAPLPELHPLTG